MGSPERPLDVEMGDMAETSKLNPDVETKPDDGEKADEDRFTGLKKDELLELSSQRKWVVARWVLFILFWLAWLGMLVGAIIIVVKAPRCKAEPTPPWFQDTVVYQADVTKFAKDFAGMSEHVDYLKAMHFKTLTICHANNPQDLAEVRGNDTEGLEKLLSAARKEENDVVKVVVDLRIDAMSTSSPEFQASASESCAETQSGQNCMMFRWKPNGTIPAGESDWVYHPGRNQSYKSTSDGLAYLDYENQQAIDYLERLAETWIGYGVDGFQLRDMSMIGDRSQQMNVVKTVQKAINKTQGDIVEVDKRKVIGLFLLGSDSATRSGLFPDLAVDNDTDSAPVVINTELSQDFVPQQIKEAITEWRNATEPFIPAYAVNTMDMGTLVERFGLEKAAGLTLFSFALPGVPVLKSGDEALLTDDSFDWAKHEKKKFQVPVNASDANVELLTELNDLRVNQHRALRSLRWDNEDAVFSFRNTNSSAVVAFTRKWDKKPTVLVIYNPSGQDVIVKVDKMDGEKNMKILVASDSAESDEIKFGSISMKSGLTLVLQIKEG